MAVQQQQGAKTQVTSLGNETLGPLQKRIKKDGVEITYEYDGWDRVKTVTGPTETITYEYDARNRVISEANALVKREFSYEDDLGRLESVKVTFLQVGLQVPKTFTYRYNAAEHRYGGLTEFVDPNGLETKYSYNRELDVERTIVQRGVPVGGELADGRRAPARFDNYVRRVEGLASGRAGAGGGAAGGGPLPAERAERGRLHAALQVHELARVNTRRELDHPCKLRILLAPGQLPRRLRLAPAPGAPQEGGHQARAPPHRPGRSRRRPSGASATR